MDKTKSNLAYKYEFISIFADSIQVQVASYEKVQILSFSAGSICDQKQNQYAYSTFLVETLRYLGIKPLAHVKNMLKDMQD